MKLSRNGLNCIVESEGLRLEAYDDVAGLLTIGVGHLLTPDERGTGTININGEAVAWQDGLIEQQAMDLLAQDVGWSENVVNNYVQVLLSQNQFDALVSFTFNVGGGAFRESTLLKVLNSGDYNGVPAQLRKWIRAGGRVVDGLVNRREREIALWGAV